MTEPEFISAYLLGQHNALRKTGEKLWDVDFYQTDVTPLEIEEAKAQYKVMKPNRTLTI